ncbi:hypothetical protein BVC93_02330 [Mycobacterium sp. MS1601]|uniref:hypothetical protein n=1 Tax=Mycobacterium sp. MS1601 TaxID=1936029 RepID=UPI00097928AD|nr:hypothetical protein [Mycobacterium sp. MS1601]AQA01463.1 hypothetical protein BVC93_02330 [Mycobacterium sp. MS1601]
MVTPVFAIAVAVMLAVLGRFTRSHPAWHLSVHARFYMGAGYLSSLIATYFFLADGGASWVFGAAWAVAAVSMFGAGYLALLGVVRRQHAAALSMETIEVDQVQPQSHGF